MSMDEERSWNRIVEAVRILAEQRGIPIPEDLESVTGDVWERNSKRRAALEAFLYAVDNIPVDLLGSSVEEIADTLDAFVLNEKEDAKRESEL